MFSHGLSSSTASILPLPPVLHQFLQRLTPLVLDDCLHVAKPLGILIDEKGTSVSSAKLR